MDTDLRGVTEGAAPPAASPGKALLTGAHKENTPVKATLPSRRLSVGQRTPGKTPTSVSSTAPPPPRPSPRPRPRLPLPRGNAPPAQQHPPPALPAPQILLKRSALANLSAEKKTKKRKSFGRRVSFAPDPEVRPLPAPCPRPGAPCPPLPPRPPPPGPRTASPHRRRPPPQLNSVHFFEKETAKSPVAPSPIAQAPVAPTAEEDGPREIGLDALSPPKGDAMELTDQTSLGASRRRSANRRRSSFFVPAPGDVTSALPSLAALAEEDAARQGAQRPPSRRQSLGKLGNVTSAIPSLSTLVEEDEAAIAAQATPARGLAAPPPGDVTAAVPSLGTLLDEDAAGDASPAPDAGNVTSAIPSLGALVDEDEGAAGAGDDAALGSDDLLCSEGGAASDNASDNTEAATSPAPSPGVPSLGGLVDEDEAGAPPARSPGVILNLSPASSDMQFESTDDATGETDTSARAAAAGEDAGNVTAAVPSLGALVDEDEGAGGAAPATAAKLPREDGSYTPLKTPAAAVATPATAAPATGPGKLTAVTPFANAFAGLGLGDESDLLSPDSVAAAADTPARAETPAASAEPEEEAAPASPAAATPARVPAASVDPMAKMAEIEAMLATPATATPARGAADPVGSAMERIRSAAKGSPIADASAANEATDTILRGLKSPPAAATEADENAAPGVSPMQLTSPLQQAASPLQQAASPLQQAASPLQQAASPLQQAASPLQQAASPLQGVSPVPSANPLSSLKSMAGSPLGGVTETGAPAGGGGPDPSVGDAAAPSSSPGALSSLASPRLSPLPGAEAGRPSLGGLTSLGGATHTLGRVSGISGISALSPLSAKAPSPGNLTGDSDAAQGKWGFVPGAEDTLGVNLRGAAKANLGDTTYHQLYGDATGASGLAGPSGARGPAPVAGGAPADAPMPSPLPAPSPATRTLGLTQDLALNLSDDDLGLGNNDLVPDAEEPDEAARPEAAPGRRKSRRLTMSLLAEDDEGAGLDDSAVSGAGAPAPPPGTSAAAPSPSRPSLGTTGGLLALTGEGKAEARPAAAVAGASPTMGALSPLGDLSGLSADGVTFAPGRVSEDGNASTGTPTLHSARKPPRAPVSGGGSRPLVTPAPGGVALLTPPSQAGAGAAAAAPSAGPATLPPLAPMSAAPPSALPGALGTAPRTRAAGQPTSTVPLMSPVIVHQRGAVAVAPADAARTPSGAGSGNTTGVSDLLASAPRGPQVFQLTVRDFLKMSGVQFLDHVRRGTSIGMGDLADDPPPGTLRECYRLLHLTRVDADGFANAVRTLQEECAASRARVGEREAELSAANPEVFRSLQLARGAELERLRAGIASLKRVCRAQTMLAWKEWRLRMEAGARQALSDSAARLRSDLAFLDRALASASVLLTQVQDAALGQRQALELETTQHASEQDRARRTATLRESLAGQEAHNAERAAVLGRERARAAELEARRAALAEQRAALEGELAAARAATARAEGPADAAEAVAEASAARALAAAREAVAAKAARLRALEEAQGWRVETVSAPRGPAGAPRVVLRLGRAGMFRLTLGDAGEGAAGAGTGSLDVAADAASLGPAVPREWVALAASVALGPAARPAPGAAPGHVLRWSLPAGAAPWAAAEAVQRVQGRLAAAEGLVAGLDGLHELSRLAVEARCDPPAGTVGLVFLHRESQTRASVELRAAQALDARAGGLEFDARVDYTARDAGETAARLAAALARVPAGPGVVADVCAAVAEALSA